MWVRTETLRHNDASAKMIFRFEVELLSGPVTQSFMIKYPEPPSRIIDIRGSQTLEMLHQAIFRAFDREDEHMYEFQFGGKVPQGKNAVRYGIPSAGDHCTVKNAETTSIAELNLKPRNVFFYWFDFGDDWWHKVRLLAVSPPEKDRRRYPRIVRKEGESPPQYADWEAGEDA
jgi:hypothetical protein